MVYSHENLFCTVIWHSCIQMLLPDFITSIYNVVYYLILSHNWSSTFFLYTCCMQFEDFFFLMLNWEFNLKIMASISSHRGWRYSPNEMEVFCGRVLPSESSEIQQILPITIPLCIAYEATKDTAHRQKWRQYSQGS